MLNHVVTPNSSNIFGTNKVFLINYIKSQLSVSHACCVLLDLLRDPLGPLVRIDLQAQCVYVKSAVGIHTHKRSSCDGVTHVHPLRFGVELVDVYVTVVALRCCVHLGENRHTHKIP